MLIVISPAKSLDFKTPVAFDKFTIPEMVDDSEKLIGKLKKLSASKISEIMGISSELGDLNFRRFQEWSLPFTPENAKQAIFAFNGDVYQGLNTSSLSEELIDLAQVRLRILSGLYGVLRPLDLMQPYRLEMGTDFSWYKSKNLYEFWNPQITKKINKAIDESGSKVLVNLASKEYFKSIDLKKVKATVITPEFREGKSGVYKMVSFFAKRARGLMTRFILENHITYPTDILAFEVEGYHFNPQLSTDMKPVFTRDLS